MNPATSGVTWRITLGPFNDAALNIIRTDAQVQSVSEDGIMNISEVQYVAFSLKRMFHAYFQGLTLLGVSVVFPIVNHCLLDHLLRKC